MNLKNNLKIIKVKFKYFNKLINKNLQKKHQNHRIIIKTLMIKILTITMLVLTIVAIYILMIKIIMIITYKIKMKIIIY